MKTLFLDGDKFNDIASFYDEVNRVFMSNEDWLISVSLDALNDLLYSGHGAITSKERIRLVWSKFEKSRADLGHDATQRFYIEKLKQPERYDPDRIKGDLRALEAGTGAIYFDFVVEIIGDHANIEMVAD
ncbi:ribonuclease inhibitor [Mesorhizobium sp. NBSH29]|uniref:barstar family protein n=1 Tax=Mesorhizobium sp. NBSH29 TaxID=2654249 RepID=UPI0018968F5E|nr:barstar family protein [Mesorhizobium sp. NBSH29]QPC88175.1 ribonuclease inhibitor [Mesorhizobium sp. NBSH29]